MALELWLMIILFVVGVAIILKLVKSVFKAFGWVIFLFVMLNFVFTIMIVRDVNDLRQNFFSRPSIYAFQHEGKITSAVAFIFPKGTGEPDFTLATQSQLERYTQALAKGNLEGIKGANYRLFLVNEEFAEAIILDEIDFGQEPIIREEALDILTQENTFGMFIEKFTDLSAEDITEEQKRDFLEKIGFEEEEQHKSLVFMASVVQGMFGRGPAKMLTAIEQYKKGNLVIHENTVFFKSMKFIPVSPLRRISQKMADKTGDAITAAKREVMERI